MRTVLAAAALAGLAACSSASDAPPPHPRTPAAPAVETAMAPIDRYRDYLARVGVDRDASVIDSAGLALGALWSLP